MRVVLGDECSVGEPWKLAGGAMHDSWAIDATVSGVRHELVVRVSPAGRADHEKTRREFEVLRVAGVRAGAACRIGRPPEELLDALGDFMRDRAAHARDRWERFQFQVAANSIGILSRELQMEDDFTREEWRGLDGLLGAESMPDGRAAWRARIEERNSALAQRIRLGEFDGDAEHELLQHVWDTVVNKVRIASPNEKP